MNKTILAVAVSAAVLAFASNGAFAQQGTTLAGPAQGSKANGTSSMQPSAASGANGGSMTRDGVMSGASGVFRPSILTPL